MRRQDWPERLAAVIDAARDKPFAWGTHDCCLFASDCVLAMTGVDPAASFRGRYDTKGGAYRRMAEFTGDSRQLAARTAERVLGDIGAVEVVPARAGRGAVVLIDYEGEDVLGVVWSGVVFLVSPGGLVTCEIGDIKRAWLP